MVFVGVLITGLYTSYRYIPYMPVIPYYPVCFNSASVNKNKAPDFIKLKGVWNKEFEDTLYDLYFSDGRRAYYFSAYDLYNHAMRIEEKNWLMIYRNLNWELTKSTIYAVLSKENNNEAKLINTISCEQVRDIVIGDKN